MRGVPPPCPLAAGAPRGFCARNRSQQLCDLQPGGVRGHQGPCRGAERQDCSPGGSGTPPWAVNWGQGAVLPGVSLPGWGVRSLCSPQVGPFLLGHQLIALSAVGVVGVGGHPFPGCVPQIFQLCLPGTGQGAPSFRVGAHRGRGTSACAMGYGAAGPGAPGLPRQGTLRVLVPQDGDKMAFHLPADHRVPQCPLCPCPARPPPRRCLCAGAAGRRSGGGNTGWSESEPGICRMSPYPDSLCFPVSISTVLLQPPAGGWQGASLGGGDLAAPLPPCSLPFLLCCPPGARPCAVNLGQCSSGLAAGGDPGAHGSLTPHHAAWLHRASVSPPRCSCGAGGVLGFVPPQPRP